MTYELFCNMCGKKYKPVTSGQRFCSKACTDLCYNTVHENEREAYYKRYWQQVKTDPVAMAKRRKVARDYQRNKKTKIIPL